MKHETEFWLEQMSERSYFSTIRTLSVLHSIFDTVQKQYSIYTVLSKSSTSQYGMLYIIVGVS